jgi:hypothetical protein
MTLRGSVFTANAGFPEADAVQVFVHMHMHTLSFKYMHTHTYVIVPDMHSNIYNWPCCYDSSCP